MKKFTAPGEQPAPYPNVAAHKALQEGGLAGPPRPDHLAEEHRALRLAFLQLHLFLLSYWTHAETRRVNPAHRPGSEQMSHGCVG